jgi:hypothetical protein
VGEAEQGEYRDGGGGWTTAEAVFKTKKCWKTTTQFVDSFYS